MTTRTKELRLTEDVDATFIHGVTGQDVSEDVLAAGTLVRVESALPDEWGDGNATTFLASTDGGRLWYRYRTYGDLPTD